MQKSDVTAFVRRDWPAIAALKRRRWAEQKRHMTAVEVLRIGDELRYHVTSLRRDWPTKQDRRRDLAVHIRVAKNLRLAKPPKRR